MTKLSFVRTFDLTVSLEIEIDLLALFFCGDSAARQSRARIHQEKTHAAKSALQSSTRKYAKKAPSPPEGAPLQIRPTWPGPTKGTAK